MFVRGTASARNPQAAVPIRVVVPGTARDASLSKIAGRLRSIRRAALPRSAWIPPVLEYSERPEGARRYLPWTGRRMPVPRIQRKDFGLGPRHPGLLHPPLLLRQRHSPGCLDESPGANFLRPHAVGVCPVGSIPRTSATAATGTMSTISTAMGEISITADFASSADWSSSRPTPV
jgi:hypothetical protein